MAAISIGVETGGARASEFPTQKYHSGGYVRFAPITLGTNGDDTCTVPALLYDYRIVIWQVIGATVALDAGEELDIYLQTSYDGINYWDVKNVHYANGDGDLPTPIAVITHLQEAYNTTATVIDATFGVEGETATTAFFDGALADDTNIDIPLGIKSRLRIKTTNAATGTLTVTAVVK